MSAKDKIKKAFGVTGTALVGIGVAAWYLLRIPPRVVKWVLNNKFKSIALGALLYAGYGKLQDKFHFGKSSREATIEFMQEAEKNRRIAEQLIFPNRDAQQVDKGEISNPQVAEPKQTTPRTPATPNPIQAATGQVLETPKKDAAPKPQERSADDVKLDQEAETAVLENTFVSSPTADMINSSGDRVVPVGERLQYFVEKRAKKTQEPERSGMNTILICSRDNPKDFVALHVGFHLDPEREDLTEYRVYQGQVKPQEGHVPMVGVFNINFPEVPGVRLGIEVDQNGARLTDLQEGAQTLNIRKDKGRSLLMVDGKGNVNRIFDQGVMDATFAKVNLAQGGTVEDVDYTAYEEAGWDQPLKARQPVPAALKTPSR